MTLSDVLQHTKSTVAQGWVFPGLLVGSFLVAYAPTVTTLINGPWQTEQEGHGPLIIVAALWLAWQARYRLKDIATRPAPLIGWPLLLVSQILMFLGRTQEVVAAEALSIMPVIAGCILVSVGWKVLRVLAFPIGFLI